MRDRLAATEERVQSSRSQIAEVDPTEAFLRFNQQQTAYQAALASGTRMLQTSILDFLH
jgi:flagellar hook-associated protein 3 FlgL